MKRYLRLYLRFMEFSFGQGFEFRVDFFARIIMDIMFYAVSILFFKVIFGHTPSLGGWNEGQVMIFVSGFLVSDAIMMTIFSNNIYQFPQLLRTGQLDYYMIRPVNSLFFISLRSFSSGSFINLIIATGILIWSLLEYSHTYIFWNLPLYLLLIMNGVVLFYIMQMYFNVLAFWTQSGMGDLSVAWELGKFGEKPHNIYKGSLKVLLLTALPYGLMSSMPASILFGTDSWMNVLLIIGVTAIHFILLNYFWNLGLKNYSSASS